MPTHAERKFLPYSPEQMFDLVADVGKYPQFLPWCVGSRVRRQTEEELVADLTIGFGPFRESFTSRVALDRPERVRVTYENGPFRYLNNQWDFKPRGSGTEVAFFVDFEFRSRILRPRCLWSAGRFVGARRHGLCAHPAGPVPPARAGEPVLRYPDASLRRHEGGDDAGRGGRRAERR
jgi:coenzyme Q-binding protein COQ10